MFFDIFPPKIKNALSNVQPEIVNEVRLRADKPIIVNCGDLFFLGENGITDNVNKAISASVADLNDTVFKACECSIYAFNEQIKQGFVALKGGARLGVCGQLVYENGNVKTIKNFSSVALRIPHQIKNCSLKILPLLYDEKGVKNTLIISAPSFGKTTLLRDICYQFSEKYIVKNALIIDERGEIASVVNGKPLFDVGPMVDIQTNCSKNFGLQNGIRTMAPEVIFTDEIANEKDVLGVMQAIGSGVKVVATAHANNIAQLYKRTFLQPLLESKFFERIVVLSNRNGVGTIDGIFDEEQRLLF